MLDRIGILRIVARAAAQQPPSGPCHTLPRLQGTIGHAIATLPGMLSPTLRGHQVVQMCQPREEGLLAAAGVSS